MKLNTAFLAFAGIVLLTASCVLEVRAAEVTRTFREVNFRPEASLDTVMPAEVGRVVAGRDVLTTGMRSRAELQFEDGLLVRLGSNALFAHEIDERVLELEEGRALVRLPKGAERTEMKTPVATAAIIGTTVLFDLVPDPEDSERMMLSVAVLEGLVRMEHLGIDISGGEKLDLREGDEGPLEVSSLSVQETLRVALADLFDAYEEIQGELRGERRQLVEGMRDAPDEERRAAMRALMEEQRNRISEKRAVGNEMMREMKELLPTRVREENGDFLDLVDLDLRRVLDDLLEALDNLEELRREAFEDLQGAIRELQGDERDAAFEEFEQLMEELREQRQEIRDQLHDLREQERRGR